ncbi:hypothetical protein [Candidatus Albibeggiatoa sp. nov. NOAA]|uniref:hypothetical protein n=1 Tax=Candidatus Albibeggiatoa sp. nov. NOAA TaxID=3162724 RepID=UPI0032FEBAEC|nr:hypothetical protein [Thiotrichaceae bacterium]
MADWTHPKNDGWTDIKYDFGLDEDASKRVSHILNEACHVFYYHADGHWIKMYKDRYASELMQEFLSNPNLSSRVLKCGDRVVKMVAYRALELMKENQSNIHE